MWASTPVRANSSHKGSRGSGAPAQSGSFRCPEPPAWAGDDDDDDDDDGDDDGGGGGGGGGGRWNSHLFMSCIMGFGDGER